MNILLVNYRYFMSGGPERYMFAVKALLESRGHRVVPFSFDYTQNVENDYADYFAKPPGGADGAFYKDLKLSPIGKARLLAKSIYNRDAYSRIQRIINGEKIDLVYALQIVNTLYPSVVDAAHELGKPLVHRLSDFQYLCANYKFFRDGRVCEDCLHGAHYHGFVHRCLKDSYAVSGARVFSLYLDGVRPTRDKISAFVTPSRILRDKMIEGGFPAAKFHHIPTFVDASVREPNPEPGDYFLYAGAIDPFKGVHVLLDAIKQVPGARLLFAGYSLGDEEAKLRRRVEFEGISGVEFVGFKEDEALAALFQGARAVVLPALWYENVPNSILEAMAYAKPVVATVMGGIAEVVQHEHNGLLVPPGDSGALAAALQRLQDDGPLTRALGANARTTVVENYTPEHHYDQLNALFERLVPDPILTIKPA
ncbi:MAG: glycosyltransferase family 4 protein [Candidatus Hydrogenedentota bacterium]